ncbi:MAG: BRO family protein [Verrucomicrobiota bacterium]|jgi:DNA-damage-inducible protein D
MSNLLPVPAASNTFERIKRVNPAGADFWSGRELARVLEYSEFRHFLPVIEKAREACLKSSLRVEDHFEQILEMVSIGSNAQRAVEDWRLSRYACYLVIQNADPSKRYLTR